VIVGVPKEVNPVVAEAQRVDHAPAPPLVSGANT
jgi:hypothetical protein